MITALRRLVVVALSVVPRTTPLVAPRPRARCGTALGAGRAPPPDLANCVGVGEFNAALRARARSRDVAGTARAWAALVEHCAPNDRSYGILIDGHARVGDADAALAALAAVPGGGNVVQALQLSLRDPPYQTRTDSVKNMSFDVVLKVLNTVKDAEIANVVGALTMEECDVLMKYIYRGLGPAGKKNETYSKLLHWHPEVLKRAGPSSIMRAISEVSLAL